MSIKELEKQLGAVEEIMDTTLKVKGEDFSNMVKFVGTMQSFVTMVMNNIADLGADEAQLDRYSKHCALLASALCDSHAKALKIDQAEFEEVFNIVDSINDRVRKALED